MALFKIFRGPSERLKDVKPTEGYAYFTPDDGKFYIDIKTAEAPVIGNTSANGVNRICINNGSTNFEDFLIIDCGTATIPNSNTTILYYSCGDSSSVESEFTVYFECGDSVITEPTLNTILYDCGNSMN